MAKKPLQGIYITFEGTEGSGKSTQLRLVAEALAKEGISVLTTKEPGGTEVGAGIRKLLLHKDSSMLAKTESLLFWADRHQHHETMVKPALAAGTVVLGDRDFDSSWAYQHYGRGLPKEWMQKAQELAAAVVPDLTLLYDGPVELLLRRSLQKNSQVVAAQGEHADESRLERENIDFHKRIREGFLARAKAEPNRFIIFDATKSVEQLHKETLACVQKLLHVS